MSPILLVFLTLLHCTPGQAGEHGRVVEKAYFENLFNEIVAKNSPWPQKDIHTSNLTLRPISLKIPSGKITYELLSPVTPNQLGRKTFSVAVLVNGKKQGQVMMSGDVGLYGNVVCAKRALKRKTLLTSADLTTIRREVSMLGTGVVSEPELATGQMLTTTLQAGNIIYSHLLEPPPLVKRGDLVTIMARSDSIRITTAGKIKNPGAKGELVKVKNLASRREIFARVVDSSTVRVDF